jgi:hypothetical protein
VPRRGPDNTRNSRIVGSFCDPSRQTSCSFRNGVQPGKSPWAPRIGGLRCSPAAL